MRWEFPDDRKLFKHWFEAKHPGKLEAILTDSRDIRIVMWHEVKAHDKLVNGKVVRVESKNAVLYSDVPRIEFESPDWRKRTSRNLRVMRLKLRAMVHFHTKSNLQK